MGNLDLTEIRKIHPLVGVDNVHFKMAPFDVEEIWGAPDYVIPNALNERVEYRSTLVTTYSEGKDSQLIEIGFSKACKLIQVVGINLFSYPKRKRLEALLDIDNNAYEETGTVVFLSLGVSLTGFFDKDGDDSDWAVTAFVGGRWDNFLSTMTRFNSQSLERKFSSGKKR